MQKQMQNKMGNEMETGGIDIGVILRLYKAIKYIGSIQGVYRNYSGRMEKKMEASI